MNSTTLKNNNINFHLYKTNSYISLVGVKYAHPLFLVNVQPENPRISNGIKH